MPVMDEFREEREALKHGTPKEKFSYFMDYYKWHVVIAIAAIILISTLIYQIATRKDTVFFAAMINGIEQDGAEEYTQSFAEYAGIDTESYNVLFDTSMHIDLNSPSQATVASSQKLAAYISAQDVDVFITDVTIINQYAYNETFMDLRELLTDEQYAMYKPYFYYIDQTIVDAKNNAFNTGNFDYVTEYPDPRTPETMSEPIPVGIYLESAAGINENYYFSDAAIIGVVGNTPRAETVSKFIDFLLKE